MSRIKPVHVAEVLHRAQGYCEACGGALNAMEIHHRYARRMGGSKMPWIDLPINLMAVHPPCHNLTVWSIHSRKERSERLFHVIPMGVTPYDVPAPVVVRNLRELVA